MKRSLSLIVIALIALDFVCALRSSGANGQEKNAKVMTEAEISGALELIERIEALEKRIAKLERPETFVRQVNSKALEQGQSDVYVPDSRPSETERIVDGDDDENRQTNGQRWKFRLLGNRQPSTSQIR